MSPIYDALWLTSLGAIGTALGGALVIIQPNINFKRLGSLQVFQKHHSLKHF